MAAKLECEICGGKLIGKPGGVFECDSCGVEYSTEWAKAKIQEIRGTVKVEGTVEVTGKVQVDGGTVQVEGAATKESLLKRAEMCCAEKDWKKASELIEQVLNIDPECGEAYLLEVMAEEWLESKEKLHERCIDLARLLPDGTSMKRAQKFLPELFAQWKEEKERNYAAYLKKYEEAAQLCAHYAKADGLLVEGHPGLLGIRADGTVLVAADSSADEADAAAIRQWSEITAIACGTGYAVGLRADGTVVAVGENNSGQCNVENWKNITAIACGWHHTVGLRADGTVVAVGENDSGQCNVEKWRDITAIACGRHHTVGLRADGTVVAADYDEDTCNAVKGWRDIIAIACHATDTVGLRADGTAVTRYGPKCKNWHDVAALVCNGRYGLRKDGTIASSDDDEDDWCFGWSDIIAVSGFSDDLSALRSDGTVIGDCEESQKWTDIVSIYGGYNSMYGIRKDGTVVATDDERISGWRLFNSIDTLEQERAEGLARAKAARIAREKAEAERRAQKRAAILAEQDGLQAELSQLKGLFSGKRRREIEARLAELSTALRELEENA